MNSEALIRVAFSPFLHMVRSRKGDGMITINSLDVNGLIFTGIQLDLPGTSVFIVMNEVGYIMSTPLLLQFPYNETHEAELIAGTVSRAKSVDDLLTAPLEQVTESAREKGWAIGMRAKEALLKIA